MTTTTTKKSANSSTKKNTAQNKATSATKTTKTAKSKIETADIKTSINEEIKPVVKEPKKFNMNDLITCKSVRYGKLTYIAKKSGMLYEWSDFGDICEVEYGDLLALKASKSVFLYEPWFLIMDEDLATQWNLNGLYEYFDNVEDVEEFLKTCGPMKIENTLRKAPRGFRDIVVYTAGRMIREKSLDSISTIKAIDEVMHTKLTTMVGD